MEQCPHCDHVSGSEDVSPRCMPPHTILMGRYYIGNVLGEGGFGITYKGLDLLLNRKVAVKEYFPAGLVTRDTSHGGDNTVQSISGQMREHYREGLLKYENEARCLMELKGTPGIVDILSFFNENGTAYIVMEFIEGTTLRDYVADNGGRLPEQQMLTMFRPLLSALEHIHKNGIVHRDISPDNIIVQPDGALKLIDFGAARQSTGEATQSLTVVLKHGYAPEEQYRSRGKQGPFTDVYAISATIYKILTGVTPVESLTRMIEDELKPLDQYDYGISTQTSNAVIMGMRPRPAERFQTITQLVSALYEQSITLEPEKPQRPEKGKSKLIAITVAGVAAVAAITIGAVALMGEEKPASGFAGMQTTQVTSPQQQKEQTVTLQTDITGMKEKEAKKILEEQNILADVEYAPADAAHTGKVLSWEVTSEDSVRLVVGEQTNFTFEEGEDGLVIKGYNGDKRNLNIPQTINGIQVTQIGDYAFAESGEDNAVQVLSLPDGLLRIGEGAFYNCIYLTEANIPDTVQNIGVSAFWNCGGLQDLTLPSALIAVEDYAFYNCESFEKIVIPEGCQRIGKETFMACSWATTIVIPATVTQIGDGAFTGCGMMAELMEGKTCVLEVVGGSAAEEHAANGTIAYSVDGGEIIVPQPEIVEVLIGTNDVPIC